jgi:hypothetical protein
MDKETYADNCPPPPPEAIPLMDSEHNILPLQFVIDPGEEIFKKDQQFTDEIVKKLTLSEKEKLKLLKHYFDVISIKVPQNEMDLMIEKNSSKRNIKNGILEKSRTLPSSFESDDSCSDAPSASSVGGNGMSKAKAFSTKAAKQLLMITKHFGSLGRMSKRIKKNLGTLAKRGTSFRNKNRSPNKKLNLNQINSVQNYSSDVKKESFTNDESDTIYNNDSDSMIAALLHTDRRHSYYDEMIRNYLNTARARFLRQQREKKSNQTSYTANNSSSITSNPVSTADNTNLSLCVNTGCKMFGTQQNNYLCSTCFAEQKQKLTNNTNVINVTNSKDNDNYKLDDISKAYQIEEDMKVSLTSPKTKIVDEEVVITCANSHFYVPTST